MDVLLSKDDPDFDRQMRLIVNKKDKMGNTPLHYATIAGNLDFMLRGRGCGTAVEHTSAEQNS